VLTHHGRESLEMEGGTTFHFVTDGFESAMNQALADAGDDDVLVAGGASVIRHYLAAGVIDEFWLSIVPLLLGSGERPFDGSLSRTNVEVVDVIATPKATHLKYVVR
jgi:dihydrofolate reductase